MSSTPLYFWTQKGSDQDLRLIIAGLTKRDLQALQFPMRRALLQTGDFCDQMLLGLSNFQTQSMHAKSKVMISQPLLLLRGTLSGLLSLWVIVIPE